MKIQVKLYASLGSFLPPHAEKNQARMEVAQNATAHDVLNGLRVPLAHCHLVLVNGLFVPPAARDTQPLADGDHLAVWPPVAGG